MLSDAQRSNAEHSRPSQARLSKVKISAAKQSRLSVVRLSGVELSKAKRGPAQQSRRSEARHSGARIGSTEHSKAGLTKMNQLGDNNPPDMTITAGEVTKDLSRWMSEIPIIETEDQAREAKLWADRAFLCVQDLEDERQEKVRPYRKIVDGINEHYKRPRELLQGVLDELKSRMSRFFLAEEAKRKAIAEDAKRIADAAEQAAWEAERKERDAHADADTGVLGVDIADIHRETNEAYADADKAARQAALAEKETKVKLGGGFRRASSLRSTEVPYIADPLQVIEEVGITQDIEVALIKAARAFKRLHGRYPRGITVTIERSI